MDEVTRMPPPPNVAWYEIEASLAPKIAKFLNKICNELVRKCNLHGFAVMCNIPLYMID